MKAFIGFAGFGLVDIALREAGYETIGVEIDPAIAEVNQHNGGAVITADILDLDPGDFIGYDRAHFSPPCPSFSLANTAGEETDQDIALARWVARFVTVVKPEHFTLENVWMYRHPRFQSWPIILEALTQAGYAVDWWHLNAADYGVPQTRRRMVVIARRDGQPVKPFPTHRIRPDFFAQRWVGWYEAIEDLIPTLPDSQFAPWQMDRMPEELRTFLMMTGNTNRNGVDNAPGGGFVEQDRPANTVLTYSNGSLPRALLIPGDNSGNGVVRTGDQPMVTIQTRPPERCPNRAFILAQGERSTPKTAESPADTITANSNQTGVKAFIVSPVDGSARGSGDPSHTVMASEKTVSPKACLSSGRVVSMTPRALARFQGFPDWFVLPDNRTLACLGIGNAMPLGLARAMIKGF